MPPKSKPKYHYNIDLEKLQKLLNIADDLHLIVSMTHTDLSLMVTYYLREGDLRQYVELCRRLKSQGFGTTEKFNEQLMEHSDPEDPIGEVAVDLLG